MNPYEKTAAEMKRQSQGPKQFAKNAAKIGTAISTTVGTASFAPILARAAPFLSQYISEDLAKKGLSKISPKVGNFIKDAMENGYDFNEVKDFIGQQVEDSQKEKAKDNRNIIEQYSSSLFQYIKDLIANGATPVQAAIKAKKYLHSGEALKAISKIEKDHKIKFEDLVNSLFSNQTLPPNSEQQITNPQQNENMQSGQQGLDPQLAQIIQQGQALMANFRGVK